MANHQVLTCPNCGGKGCPTCQNTGRVRVTQEQLQKLKQVAAQLSRSPLPASPHDRGAPPQSQTNFQKIRQNSNLAGIIAFSFLSILAGAAAASWYFLKSFKPFLAGLVTLLILVGTRLAWLSPFFKPQEPNDFLSAIKKA